MMRFLRRVLGLALLGGLVYGVWKAVQARRAEEWGSDDATWPAPPAAEPASSTPTPVADAPTPNGEATSGPTSPAEAPGNGHGATSAGSGEGQEAGAGGRSRPKPQKGPARKAPTGKAEPEGDRMWVAATGGVCPPSHPIKAKLSSKIFHAPGARNYGRTHADRCYPDESSAVADGLRPALR
jgi:hypothetical protein